MNLTNARRTLQIIMLLNFTFPLLLGLTHYLLQPSFFIQSLAVFAVCYGTARIFLNVLKDIFEGNVGRVVFVKEKAINNEGK